MTKTARCKICELLGNDQTLSSHGLSHPCHLTNFPQPPSHHLASSPNINYLNHGLLNGLYLPQLKDMMLAAYLLRGKVRVAESRPDTARVSFNPSGTGGVSLGFSRWDVVAAVAAARDTGLLGDVGGEDRASRASRFFPRAIPTRVERPREAHHETFKFPAVDSRRIFRFFFSLSLSLLIESV